MKNKIANHLMGWGAAIILILFIVVVFRACGHENKEPPSSTLGKNYGSPQYAEKIKTPLENGLRLKTNCRGIDNIGILPAGKDVVEITHLRSNLIKEERCSQSFDEQIKLSGWNVEREYVNSLTLPTKQPGNSFVLRNNAGDIVAWTNISKGRKSYLRRPPGNTEDLKIQHFANIIVDINGIEIGWDGSSVKFEFRW